MSNTDKNSSEEVDLGQIFNAIGYVRTSRKNTREKKPYGGKWSLTKAKQQCAHIPFCGQKTRSHSDAEVTRVSEDQSAKR